MFNNAFKMIGDIGETILSLINAIKQLFNLFISFFPSPLDGIIKTFCLILLVLCVIKLSKILTGIVGNIISSII